MSPLPSRVARATMSRPPLRAATSLSSLSRKRAKSPGEASTTLTSPSSRSSSRRSALPPGWSDAFETDDGDVDELDDEEYVHEKVTLLTSEGIVVLPGRKVRRQREEGPRARWRREAERRRRRDEREARGSPPPRRTPAERAAIRALEETLPGTWAPFSETSLVDEENEDGSPLLVFASPFAVSASNGVDRGRVVRLDGYTRCPDSLGAAVELAARSLRGGVVGRIRRRPPPTGSHLKSGLLELSVELPALYGCPPALDKFVAALGASDETHVIEKIVRQWHFSR